MVKDYKGDPAATLLEILDPNQNKIFTDNYIEEPFDLSNILFILTANNDENIPTAILDRVEVINLSSYTVFEKKDIAKNYMLPKILLDNMVYDSKIKFSDELLCFIINNYTSEAGVRDLERVLSSLARKITINNVKVLNSYFEETARSGIWYTNNITINDSIIDAPKQFRRSSYINLFNVKLNNALETMWNCHDITLHDCYIKGDYFAMNSHNIECNNIKIDGNYCFDGGKNIVIKNAILNSEDSFWNCENVTVYDSTIIGEYLGWNSKNITFINCNMESLQGFCYMENLKLVNCKLNVTLAFEYSTVDADINSKIDSVKNPNGGIIRSLGIGKLILDDNIKTSKNACKYEVKECIASTK